MKMPFYLKKFQTRLIIVLCLLIILSSSLSFLVFIAINNRSLRDEIQADQRDVAVFAMQLLQKTDLPVEEIVKISTSAIYQVEIVDSTAVAFTEEEIAQLDRGEIVALYRNPYGNPFTYFQLNGKHLEISLRSHVNVYRKAYIRVSFTLLSCVGLFFLFIHLAAGRALRPISQISSAMQKVAQGDFSVHLPVKRKDEMGLLMGNFNQMVQKLQSIEYMQKDFIGNISHEYKTPIAAIQGFATLLQSPDTTLEEQQEYTGIILAESRRLSRLSQNLLRLSKLETQQKPPEGVTYALDEQLRQAVLLLEPEWAKKDIRWDLQLEKVSLRADEELMQQVWINLLENAIKFSPEGGEISIILYVGAAIKVRIQDHGIGMEEETQKRIFEKFYQGVSPHSNEGNGLGLTLVKRIMDLTGGVIRVKSAPGQGSTFTVEMPRE